MPRPQFTLRALLVAMLAVAVWPVVRPPLFVEFSVTEPPGGAENVYFCRCYGWRNGTVFCVERRMTDWLPGVGLQFGVDVESLFDQR